MILCILLCPGCQSTAPDVSHDAEGVLASSESGYIAILAELTEVMQAQHADPEINLRGVREYVTANRDRIAEEINVLNRAVLAKDESERDAYRAQVSPRVESALESYARAQKLLLARMNDAQKWELGEALSALR